MDKELLKKLFDAALSFFAKKAPAVVSGPVAPVEVKIDPPAPAAFDWSNPKSKLSKNFSVGEALLLPSWSAYHSPSEEEKAAIKGIAEKVSAAIVFLEKKLGKELHVDVHAWMRPAAAKIPGSKWDGQDYNRYIYETQVWKDLTPEQKALKHVPNSPHKTGHAIDFHVIGFEGKANCAKIRSLLEPELENLGLRMEDLDGGWVHLDDLPVVNKRFFKP